MLLLPSERRSLIRRELLFVLLLYFLLVPQILLLDTCGGCYIKGLPRSGCYIKGLPLNSWLLH
jgi:hypothetical protein